MEKMRFTEVTAPPNLYPGFLNFSLRALVPNSRIPCAVRLEAINPTSGKLRLHKVLEPGEMVTAKWRASLLAQGMEQGYISVDDLEGLQSYLHQATQEALKHEEVEPETRHHLVYENALCSMKAAMLDPRNGRRLSQGVATVKGTIEAIWEDEHARSGLLQVINRDRQLFTHSLNVCLLGAGLARNLQWPRFQVESLALALFFHDLGLAEIWERANDPDTPLNAQETAVYRDHPRRSRDYLFLVPGLDDDALETVYNHHENLDGSGFPRGLKEDRLPPASRLARIVDAYESMTSGQIGQELVTPYEALNRMKQQMRHQLDQTLLEGFVRFLGQT